MLLQTSKGKSHRIRLYLEQGLPYECNCRPVKWTDYLTFDAAAHVLYLSREELFKTLRESKKIHGLMLEDGTIFVHPDGLIPKVKRRIKCVITQAIEQNKEILKSLEHAA